MNADQFNALYPVGTLVFAYPGFRPEDASDARRLVTRTRTAAQLSPSGDPVVWVEGEGSYICLTHVDPVPEDVWEAARAAEKPAEPEATPTPTRLTPEREAEIAERTPKRAAALTAWIDKFSPFAEGQRALENAETVLEEDVPALLAELAAVRAERDRARAALSEACDQVAELESDLGGAMARIAELERPAIEAKRNEIRQSFTELIAAAEEAKDFEGAFDVQCRLREREEQWKREDGAVAS